jgi:hypothetical protein
LDGGGFVRLVGGRFGALCECDISFNRGLGRTLLLRRAVKEVEEKGTDNTAKDIQNPARDKDDRVVELGEIGSK